MIVCAGKIEAFDFAIPIGIGLIESAINLNQIVQEKNPKEIVFVGSAGSYGKYEILDIIESCNASNIEHSLLNGDAYTPIENKIVSCETQIIVNSSNYITTSKSISKLYLEHKISLENMEFYSVVKVAQHFNIKVKGIFVVTNYCDEFAHEDFIKNHKKAMKMLEDYISEK